MKNSNNTKVKEITKSQYNNIKTDNTRSLAVKRVKNGLTAKEVIFSGVDKIAELVISPEGVKYYSYE